MIDLHTHSTASDGNLSPSALIAEAVKLGFSAIALTDHDSIEGLAEAAEAASGHSINFIPGIEIEIIRLPETPQIWDGEFHLLGLDIKNPTQEFKATIDELAKRRQERNIEIIENMNKAGISISYEEITALAGKTPESKPYIGRPHFAAFLVKRKIVRNIEQAFSRYLSRGKPFFFPKLGLDFEFSARLIRESGGIAVLAHPMSLHVSWGRLPELLINLKEKGLNGIEAWHPSTKLVSCKRLEELGRKLGLLITAGSDYHGEERHDRKLGFTAGGKKIDQTLSKNSIWALHDSNM